jgi:hypothetical protein
MTSTNPNNYREQINLNDQNLNVQNCFEHLIIEIWNLFVICFLLFSALNQNCVDFMNKHQIVFERNNNNKNIY